MAEPEEIIDILRLTPHPEGGCFYENYRSEENTSIAVEQEKQEKNLRNLSKSIYFLLKGNQVSAFHRLKSDELWYLHLGSPLIVYFILKSGDLIVHMLGNDLTKNERPQLIIPRGTLFGAEVMDKYSFALIGCMVSPGFRFDDFELSGSEDLLTLYPQHSSIINKLTLNDH